MNRYRKNINVIGEEGQNRLASSSVFIVGCGALGGQLAMLLAGAGIGRIGIADFDTIDVSNLQRQLFFNENIVGKSKAMELGDRMGLLNSNIEIVIHNTLISKNNAEELMSGYDIISDATDNPATKYFIDETARKLGTPCCIGGVAGWHGQVIFFSNRQINQGMSYKDVFPMPEVDPSMLPCEVEGVMGPAASAIASLQASEIIQYLCACPANRFNDRMTVLDLSKPSMNAINLP